MLYRALLAFALCASALAENALVEGEPDPRFFLFNTSDLSISLNSVLAGALALLGGLALLAGLAYLLFLLSGDSGTGYSGYSGQDYASTGYTSYSSGRSASGSDPYSAIWDNLSVLDWIAMMEEVYRKFDANKMECQQRVVCELHQNENTWGSTARKMNDAFGYLQYLELLNLPADLRVVLDQYLEAANRGRSSQKSCEELYANCEFSVKALISKYNGSNSI
ncbi:uncharacterized protein LOC122385256 isoform X3 [Amphibalanus amphitrite]|uniref:uncharacterized protein LOC122384856 isoform X2 n=1 Tax=Amphibalanus amphitrite TaxID=1232801 RepID=UPI001C915E85|nr:uncharacterized protein LOC122384856 isoform X2 [Amphibalanus amphitrite]XP_043229332.1 uncharacterized protein LOC122385256 isoform X3 [Amphibalanus amphitrite]